MESSVTGAAPQKEDDADAETVMNLALLDPPRFGWSAIGGVVDVLPPHERARRLSAREAHIKLIKGRERRSRKKREASGSKFLPSTQWTQQNISMQRSAPFQDSKPAARLKDPPSASQSGQNIKQNGSNGLEVAPSGSATEGDTAQGSAAAIRAGPSAAPNETSILQQYVTSGMTMAAQGIAAGFASIVMNKGERASSVAADTGSNVAAAAADAPNQSAAASEVSVTSRASSHTNRESESNVGEQMQLDTAAAVDNIVTVTAAAQSRDTAKDVTAAGASDKTARGVIRVKALNDDGVLDMYTYHRGREGMEPRDDETGELLCDVEPTDTNHGWEPPSMKISINISFPLLDDYEEADNEEMKSNETRRQTQGQQQGSGLQYTETIEWDLADPNTMTPMGFSAKVSEEFGLDAGQTFDLAQSIQKQINYFVQNKVSYKTPLTLLDANGSERFGASAHSPDTRGPPQLYGSAIGETKAGMPIPQKLVEPTKTALFDGGISRRTSFASNPSFASNVESEYIEEMKRRLREASIKQIMETSKDAPGGNIGILEEEHDTVCHACMKRKNRTFKLACDNKFHALCSNHVERMLKISVDSGDLLASDYCPICALTCDCRKCSKKLSAAAANLKRYCIEQDVPPEEAPSDFTAFIASAKVSESVQVRRPGSASRPVTAVRDRRQWKSVPKVPVSDFPREVFAGKDMDPGTVDDYRTVFTAEGTFLRDDLPVAGDAKVASSAPLNSGTLEDGNVDYCHACKKHGNLLCCDFCPRAFHADCIAVDESDSSEGAWECVVCRHEKVPGEDDFVTGQSSMKLVCASFVDFKHSEGIDICTEILALVHETLLKLMDYDFGILFREPVDCEAIPAYRTIVKHPMDLGTIVSRIVDGEYAKKYEENNCWDDVVVAVLQDIELVWHNCFLFNLEGSSIYRMAEVQRRKYLRIRERSFDSLLSLKAKRSVDEYVAQCELDRSKVARVQLPTADRRTGGRHKITVGPPKKNTKIIAVLDPGTGLLVKMYSTVKAASLATFFLAGLGHPVECPNLSSENVFRSLVVRMSKDPMLLLFGYRWLYLDDLLGRKVMFSQSEGRDRFDSTFDVGIVEVKIGNDLFAFPSIEEAVSWPDLPGDVSAAEIRRKLIETPAEEWTVIGEFSWRKFGRKQDPKKDAAARSAENDEASSKKRFLIVDVSRQSFPSNISFVKEDLITRRVLVGFENAASAHDDWLKTRESSPICPVDEPAEFEYFKLYYLDGERNIDGIIWRSIRATRPVSHTNTVSTAAPESVDKSSERKAFMSDMAEAQDSGVENVYESMCTDNRVASSSGKDPVGQGDISKGATLRVAETEKAPDSNKFGNISGHRGALHDNMQQNGDLLCAKRSHANDDLGSCRATKKAAVCYT